jgi:hypothetical protein
MAGKGRLYLYFINLHSKLCLSKLYSLYFSLWTEETVVNFIMKLATCFYELPEEDYLIVLNTHPI